MTQEDAAKCITDFIEHFDELGFYDYYKDALDMALAALNGDLGWEFIIFMLEKNYPEDLFGDSPDLGGRTLRAIRWLEKERAALSGWVRTADRVPDAADGIIGATGEPEVLTICEFAHGWFPEVIRVSNVREMPKYYRYWMPLPEPPGGLIEEE